MPEISRFFGIVIFMYTDEHPPAHFHARYGGQRISVNIETLAVERGRLSPRVTGMILEWAHLHQQELLENWESMRSGRTPKHILPLE
jgi:hypothetical protein